MGTMTIRGIDEETAKRLKEHARREGASVNAVLLRILREVLGVSKKRAMVYDDLDRLAGTWNSADYLEFKRKTADFEKVDEDLWK